MLTGLRSETSTMRIPRYGRVCRYRLRIARDYPRRSVGNATNVPPFLWHSSRIRTA